MIDDPTSEIHAFPEAVIRILFCLKREYGGRKYEIVDLRPSSRHAQHYLNAKSGGHRHIVQS